MPFSFPANLLQNLLRVEKIHSIMSFLPIILNQLFKVLVQNEDDEISTAITRYPYRGLRRRDLIICGYIKLLIIADGVHLPFI